MESLRNEPVSFGAAPGSGGMPVVINTPSGGGYSGESGLLSTVLLASMLGGRGLGNGYGTGICEPSASFAFAQRTADNSSELLRDVAKSEGDIKEAFSAGQHRNQIETAAHFTALMNRSCDVEKEAIKSGYESRLEALQTKSDLLANQNTNTISIKDDIKDFRFETSRNFCDTNSNINNKFCELDHKLDKQFHHIEHVIDKGFDKMVERDYKEEIRRLRDQLDKQEFKSVNSDLKEIRNDVDRILCGLGKLTPTNLTTNVLSGCC